MMNDVAIGEIVFCDLKVLHKGVSHTLKNVVYKNDGKDTFFHKNHLEKIKIKEPVKIIDVNIISRLGFENKQTNKSVQKNF